MDVESLNDKFKKERYCDRARKRFGKTKNNQAPNIEGKNLEVNCSTDRNEAGIIIVGVSVREGHAVWNN